MAQRSLHDYKFCYVIKNTSFHKNKSLCFHYERETIVLFILKKQITKSKIDMILLREQGEGNMKTLLTNGTIQEIDHYLEENDDCFGLQEVLPNNYIYNGSGIRYDIDSELVKLHSKFQDLLFPDSEYYDTTSYSMPIALYEAGYNSYYCFSKDGLQKLIDKIAPSSPTIYRHLYLADCQFLLSTIQNLAIGLDYSFVSFFIKLCNLNVETSYYEEDDVLSCSSYDSICLASLLESYYTKAYSVLDMLTKVVYELEHFPKNISHHQKLQSANIMWGKRKNLRIYNQANTLFYPNDTVRLIESIRNEVVHNGSWEQHPKVFLKLKDKCIIERYMLFPDSEGGILSNLKNRKHFFGNETRVNDVLPKTHMDFLKMLLNTVSYINKNY